MLTQTNNIAIKLTNVSKRYTIHHEKPTLVEYLIKDRNEEFWALKDINLEIKKGEKVGIIGPKISGRIEALIFDRFESIGYSVNINLHTV